MIGYVQLATTVFGRNGGNINPIYMSVFYGSTTSMLMQYLDAVLLSRWSYEAQGPTSGLGGQNPLRTPRDATLRKDSSVQGTRAFFSRLKFGWEESFRARSASTPWQINRVPKFFPDHPEMVPTKTQFLYRSAQEFLLSLVFLDALKLMGRDTSMTAIYFAPTRVPFFTRLQDVTVEEATVRLIASVMHWVTIKCLLQLMYDGAAILIIASDLGRIERWPPLYGAWTECWSIRQFWG